MSSAAVMWDDYMLFFFATFIMIFLVPSDKFIQTWYCKTKIESPKNNSSFVFLSLSCFVFTLKLQVAEIIKEDLWPNPLKYFNNVISFSVFLLSFCFTHIIPVLCSILW